jgi:hypothetical protein
VLHYGRPGTLDELVPGMIFTDRADDQRRPARHQGRPQGQPPYDGWTIVTRDRSLSAQWEHTVLVTETGYEVLTLSAGSPPPPAFAPRATASGPPQRERRGARRRRLADGCRQAPWTPVSAPGRVAEPARASAKARRAARAASAVRGRPPPRRRSCCRHWRATSTTRCAQPGQAGHARRRRAGRRGRLRPRRAVPLLRRRRAGAAAGRRPATAARRPDRRLHHRLLGHRPGDRLSVRTCPSAWPRRRRDVTVQTALLESRSSAAPARLYAAPPHARPRWTPRPSCAPRRSRCSSATSSTRARRTRWSPTARKARAACATCRW